MKKLITTGIKKQIQTSLKNRKGEERPDRENNEENAHFYLEIYAGKRHKGSLRGMENGFSPKKRLVKNRGSRYFTPYIRGHNPAPYNQTFKRQDF
jgi:hypothetical protein